MDINNAKEFMNKVMAKATSYDFEECEVCFGGGSSMSLDILKGEVSSFENSADQAISFRGKLNGQMGAASTTDINDDGIEFLLSEAKANAEVLDDDDEDFFYCDPDNKTLHSDQRSGNYSKNDYERFKSVGLSLEKAILASDSRITDVDYLTVGCSTGFFLLNNSKGLDLYRDSDSITIIAEARAEENGVTKTADHFWYGVDIDKFDEATFVKVLKDKLVNKFGAKSVKSGQYNIILGNEATISMMSTFFGVFSSYAMQKGISLLAGKEGEKIASDIVTLKEAPTFEKALIKSYFDDEGVLNYEKKMINNGVFETALYNLKTANKEGKKSTGNGYRGSISATNVVLEPGDMSFEDLCREVGDGLYITDLSGLHAGVNEISGDFSLLCEGYLIKDGKVGQAVEQITVADNFFNVLKKISSVGNDLLSYPGGKGEMFCPSVIVKDVSVSGEE